MKHYKNPMMILSFLAVTASFISCKKDDNIVNPSVVGLWKGKYGAVGSYPTNGYAMLFRNNGTVRAFNSADTTSATKAEGTYTISGSTITTNYTYIGTSNTYSTSSTFNSQYTFMEGTYGIGASTTGGGQFFLVKE